MCNYWLVEPEESEAERNVCNPDEPRHQARASRGPLSTAELRLENKEMKVAAKARETASGVERSDRMNHAARGREQGPVTGFDLAPWAPDAGGPKLWAPRQSTTASARTAAS